MKKVLLLSALCMALTLVFAPVAIAQSSSASAGAEQTPDSPCPGDIDEFPLGTQCGEGGGYIVPEGGSVTPAAGGSDEPCDGGPSVETPDGTRCLDPSSASPTSDPTASPSASATASASASASATSSATATASASASPLPETGGPVSVLALGSLALLVGTSILAFGIMRRS